MAISLLTLDSDLLHRPVSVTLLLPAHSEPKAVLTMLHGYSDGCGSALLYSSLARYFMDLPVAVVMPEAEDSFYLDTAYGQPYWQYISRELPERLNQWLRLELPCARRYVAGISMGGYGAAKMALSQPGELARAFLFSPVTDLAAVAEHGFDRKKDPRAPTLAQLHMDALLGNGAVRGTENDLFYLLSQASELPAFSVYTGTEDFLYEDITRFFAALRQAGAAAEFCTSPGTHCWDTWDHFLRQMAATIAAEL